jgi:4-amino-4-deoxy-L-arabinose transferase-like glycosyltransferase
VTTTVSPRDDRWRRAMLVVTVAAAIRLVFAALIPAFPDESYYWEWSRHLAPGYFDHPGGIALLIRIGTIVLAPLGAAPSALSVRLGAVIAGWIAGLATIAIARHLRGDGAALRAAVILAVVPLAAAGLILATPDAPLLAAEAVGLYCVIRALAAPVRSAASLRWWIVTGVALGAAFCSKYTSIFLPVGVVLAILIRPSLRARLAEPGPYVACAIATLIFLPVLIWNAHHEWISFVFQVRHGLSAPQGSALRAAWRHEGDFFGGQIALASPILFFLLAIATARALRRRATDAEFVLGVVTALSFCFFVYSALRQRVEPNWPAPAYIPAIALLAATTWSLRGERWMSWGVGVAAAMSILIYAQGIAPVLPIPPRKDPIARAFGWRELAVDANAIATAASAETGKTTWLGADRYQEASEIAFHLPAHPTTFATNLGGRANQYDLWPGFAVSAASGDNLVLALDESRELPDVIRRLSPHFNSTRRGPLITMRRGDGEIGTRRLWTLFGWRGGWPAAR